MLFADADSTIINWIHIAGAVCTVFGTLASVIFYFGRITGGQKKVEAKVDGLDRTLTTFISRADSEMAQQRQHHHELRNKVEDHHGRLGRIEGRLDRDE